MKQIDKLFDSIKDISKEKTKAYDTQATVTRVDGGTVYVHIPGGVDETPIDKTVSAKPGDVVQVRVANGKAWATGNATAPPTDDSAALRAEAEAAKANQAASSATQSAQLASEAAADAQQKATTASTAAAAAQSSADAAATAAATADSKATAAGTAAAAAQTSADNAASAAATADSKATAASSAASRAETSASAASTAASQAITDAAAAQTAANNAGQAASRAQAAADAAQGEIDEQQEYFWHDALGAHVLSDTDEVTGNRYRTDLKGAGQEIFELDGQTETSVAKFGADGARLGKGTTERLDISAQGITGYNAESVPFFNVDYNGGQTTQTEVTEKVATSSSASFSGYINNSTVEPPTAPSASLLFGEGDISFEDETDTAIRLTPTATTDGSNLILIIQWTYGYTFVGLMPTSSNMRGRYRRSDLPTNMLRAEIAPALPSITPASTSSFSVTSYFSFNVKNAQNVQRSISVWIVTEYTPDGSTGGSLNYKVYAATTFADNTVSINGGLFKTYKVERDVVTTAPSFTFGTNGSDTSGSWSSRLGQGLIAESDNQVALGKFNENKTTDIFEVGKGTADDARSNALEVTAAGALKAASTITDGSGNKLSDRASTTQYGMTQLVNSYSSTATDKAATPYAVKQAYDKAQNALDAIPEIDSGRTASITAAANSYKDLAVSFDTSFSSTPKVVCSIYSTSTAGAIGSLTCSALNVTTTGFTVRVFNAGSASRSPAVDWIAING